MRRFSLVLLIALASPLAAQTGRHTITHEDVFLMKRVAGPVISPDGRWIVFSVSEPSYTEGEQVTDLWLVPTDGSTHEHQGRRERSRVEPRRPADRVQRPPGG